MAKYEITHSCGCTETVNICGTNAHGERDKRIAWLSSIPCRECEARAAAERAADAGLPELSGTPKQVAWALDIREGIMAKIDGFAEKFTGVPGQGGRVAAVYEAMRAEIAGETSAKWFIDHQVYDTRKKFAEAASKMFA